MTDSKKKLSETSWEIISSERRSVNRLEFIHFTIRCARCGNISATLLEVGPGAPPEPLVELCACISIQVKEANK